MFLRNRSVARLAWPSRPRPQTSYWRQNRQVAQVIKSRAMKLVRPGTRNDWIWAPGMRPNSGAYEEV